MLEAGLVAMPVCPAQNGFAFRSVNRDTVVGPVVRLKPPHVPLSGIDGKIRNEVARDTTGAMAKYELGTLSTDARRESVCRREQPLLPAARHPASARSSPAVIATPTNPAPKPKVRGALSFSRVRHEDMRQGRSEFRDEQSPWSLDGRRRTSPAMPLRAKTLVGQQRRTHGTCSH